MASDITTRGRRRCRGITKSGERCQLAAYRDLDYCNVHRDPDSRCPARSLRDRPCRWERVDGEEFCEYHLPAREEGWNWWEWDDRTSAEALRQQLLEEWRDNRGDARVASEWVHADEIELEYEERQTVAPIATTRSRGGKSRIVAALLALFLGSLGIHRFYLGHAGLGVFHIVLLLFGVFPSTIWAFINAIQWFTMSDQEFDHRYN